MKNSVTILVLAALEAIACSAEAASLDERGWKEPVPVESRDNGDTSSVQVAFGGSDRAVAVWTVTNGDITHVWAGLYTAATGWDGGAPIDGTLSNGEAPQAAVDPLGNGTAVWAQPDGVRAARRPANGIWSDPVPLQLSVMGGSFPQVATDSAGNAIAVWSQDDGGVWSSRFTISDGRWDRAVRLDNGTGSAAFPDVAVSAAGNALAVWRQSDGRIWSNEYSVSGRSWSGATQAETAANGSSSPQVAYDGMGDARAVWVEFNPTDGFAHIVSSRYSNRQWSSPKPLESNAGNAFSPQLVVDLTGHAVVVWHQLDTDVRNIWANRTIGPDQWDTAKNIDSDDTGDAISPSLAMDSDGVVVVTWHQRQPDAQIFGVWGARYTPGGEFAKSWTHARLIEHDNRGSAFTPRVAFDANRAALALWVQSDGRRFHVISDRFDKRQWGEASKVGVDVPASRAVGLKSTAMDADGNLIALWAQQVDGLLEIWQNRSVAGRWGTAAPIASGNAGDALNPVLAFDRSGNAMALWVQFDGPDFSKAHTHVWSRFFSATERRWEPAQRVSTDDTFGVVHPQVAYDERDAVFVAVWSSETPSSNSRVWWSHSTSTSWTRPERIDNGQNGGGTPQVAVDRNGRVLSVWANGASIVANRFDGSWGGAKVIYTADSGFPSPVLRMDGVGNALVVWDMAGRFPEEFSRAGIGWKHFTADGTWSDAQVISGVFLLNLAVAEDGNASLFCNLPLAGRNDYRLRVNHYTAKTNSWEGLKSVVVDDPINANVLETQSASVTRSIDGDLLAAWGDYRLTPIGLVSSGHAKAGFSSGANWTPAFALDRVDSFATETEVMFTPSGGGVVTWVEEASDRTKNVWSRRYE